MGGAYREVSTGLNNNSDTFVYSACLMSIKVLRTLLRCKVMYITLLKQKKRYVLMCSLFPFSALIKEDQSQSFVNSGQAIVFNDCMEFSRSNFRLYVS